MSKTSTESLASYRLMVTSRVIAAAMGGYLLASLATIVLALLLPVLFSTPRAEALLTASLWSFLIYAIAVIYVFTAQTATRAWLVLTIAGVALGGVYAALRLFAH